MASAMSASQKHLKEMEDAGRVVPLNSPKDLEKSIEFDKQMTQVKQNFKIKERESQISASGILVTH